MTGCLKTVGFILFFPFTIPIWLWQRGWPGKLGALLFMFVFAAAVGSIPTPEERVALDARATVIAGMPTRTPTPVPTDTPVPPSPTNTVTAPPLPPATLAPTATPAPPTPTYTPNPPTATPTDDGVENYARQMGQIIDDFTGASDNLANLFSTPQIGDYEWTLDVGIQLGVVRVVAYQVQQIIPPVAFDRPHQTLAQALTLCDSATQDIAAGLDALDSDQLNRGVVTWARCSAGIAEAGEQLSEVMKE